MLRHLLLLLRHVLVARVTTPAGGYVYEVAYHGGCHSCTGSNHTTGERFLDAPEYVLQRLERNSSSGLLQDCETLCSAESSCAGFTLSGNGCYTVNETRPVATWMSGASYVRYPKPTAPVPVRFPVRGWSVSCQLFNNSAIYQDMNLLTEGAPPAALASLAGRNVSVLQYRDLELPFAESGRVCRRYPDSAECLDAVANMLGTEGTSGYFSGVGLDEWTLANKSDWGSISPTVDARKMLLNGLREGRRRYPKSFVASWVTQPDDAFAALMADGTIDLAMVRTISRLLPAPVDLKHGQKNYAHS